MKKLSTKNKFLNKIQSASIFENGFIEYNYAEMCGYARYAHQVKKWSKDKIEKSIRVKFFDKGKNIVLLRDIIHKAVLSSKYDFLEVESVVITKAEIEKIKLIKNRKYQKAVFGILVFAKKGGVCHRGKPSLSCDDSVLNDICKKVGVIFNPIDFEDFLIFSRGLIHRQPSRRKGYWILEMAEDDETYCTITEFERVQDYIPTWCKECGKETNKRRDYCDECGKEIRKEINREWMKKQREKSVDD